MWFAHTRVPGNRCCFGGSVGWGGQARDDHAVPLRWRSRALWPQTVLGCACLGALAVAAPAAIPYALLIAGGLALAVPLCVVTASPAVGAALLRAGIGRLPEEIAPSPLDALGLPALCDGRVRPGKLATTTSLAQRHASARGDHRDARSACRAARGVVRSLRIYYGGRGAARRARPPLSALCHGRATSYSISAAMWATASPHFAASARESSWSSRSRRWRRRCGCSTAATRR